MPSKPPSLKKHNRKAWQRDPNKPDNRTRGRRGVELRQRRLAAEPLCRHCRAEGRVTQATVPDHIIPLARGGSDDDDNIQCLCGPCHAIKTVADSAVQPPRRGS